MNPESWLAFFGACWLISLSPGPGAVSAMSSALRVGFRGSLFNFLGLQLGLVAVLLVVGSGLGALVVASPVAFSFVKWAGVAYLLWLGLRTLRASSVVGESAGQTSVSRASLVAQGFLVNATNPKGIVFMLAVLPQFVDPTRPQVIQYALCGAALVVTDLVVMNGYALLASRVLALLRSPTHARWINRILGSLFIAAAAALASSHG
jgi:homoserine/homoserine lactone efflux protein